MYHRSCCFLAGAIAAIVLLAFGVYAETEANFNYTDCGSTVEVYSVKVEPCDEPAKIPGGCQLRKGTNHIVTIVFNSGARAMQLVLHDIKGRFLGMWPRFPKLNGHYRNRNACSHLDSGCPMPPNTNITYSYPVEIASFYPEMDTVVQYTLTGRSSSNVLVCYKMNARIVNN